MAIAMALPSGWAIIIVSLAAVGGGQFLVAGQVGQDPSFAQLRHGGRYVVRMLVSACLLVLVLGFMLLLTLLTTTLVVIGVMAGSGFDFDLAGQMPDGFEQAMMIYRDTPGWLICQGVFLFGLAVWVYAIARALAFVPGVIIRQRVIALEAFNWTRGHGIRILAAAMICLVLPVLFACAVIMPGPDEGLMQTALLALGLVPVVFVSTAFLAALSVFVPAAHTDEIGD